MKGRSKLVLIGPYPPPAGGVSVHVQRLASLLEAEYDVRVLDPYRRSASGMEPLVTACGPPGPGSIVRAASAVRGAAVDLVHIHVSSMNRFAYGGHVLVKLLPKAPRKMLTIHSGSFVPDYRAANGVTRAVVAGLLRSFDFVIAVSPEIGVQLEKCGVQAGAISVLPAFIPPVSSGTAQMPACLSSVRTAGRKLLVSSGYGIRDYGFDVILNALSRSEELQAGCSVAICLYNTYDEDYVGELEESASRLPGVTIFRDLSAAEFGSLLAVADVYVRATNRDGDAVAIREAAHYGKPVVASDCVVRPDGCRMFRTGAPESLAEALRAVLSDARVGIVATDGKVTDRYIDLYRRCLDGPRRQM
jgi:glycosyltransferase involved in cell wall biosynthesis